MKKWLSTIVVIVCAISFSQNVWAQSTEYAIKGDLKAFSVNGAAGNTYVWKLTHPDHSVQTLSSTGSSSGDITFTNPGSYVLWVQATDAFGCLSEPIVKTIIARTEVTITASMANASENAGIKGQFIVDLGSANATGANVTISLTVTGTATSGTDYTAIPTSIVIPNGSQTAAIDVSGIINDLLVESNETVIVSITGSDQILFPIAANPSSTTATVTIADNDVPVTPTIASLTTNDTTPLITGNATIGPEETLTVTANGITYTAGDGNLVLSGTTWSLQIPAAHTLTANTYEVTAKATSNSGLSSTDTTTNELTIYTNQAPVAGNDYFATSGENISGNMAINDVDPEGGSLTYNTTPVLAPTKGTLTIQPNGSFIYVVLPTASGTDEFIYEVCDNGIPIACSQAKVTIDFNNHAPIAVTDDYLVAQGTVITGRLNLNDSDPDGQTLFYSYKPILAAAHGTVEISYDGSFIYTPESGYRGNDSFTYLVCDKGIPAQCATAQVLIQLTNLGPIVTDDTKTTTMNTPVSGNVLTNDSDLSGDQLILKRAPISGPSNGTIKLEADGSYTYTPNAGFFGQDQIIYEVCDNFTTPACTQGTLNIKIDPEIPLVYDRLATNDINITLKNKPVSGNVLTNDAGFYNYNSSVSVFLNPVNGALNLNADGNYTYTPRKDYTGIDNFYYTVCTAVNPADCDTVNVTIQVIPDVLSMVAPIAIDDEIQSLSNTVAKGNVLSNDLSISDEELILNLVPKVAPKSGTLVLNDSGSFTYQPKSGFTGQDYFIYEVCGSISGYCSQARVTITVSNDQTVKLFAADDVFFSQGDVLQGNLLANDVYPSLSTLTINATSSLKAAHGTVSIGNNGVFNYKPISGFAGTDQFVYEICDTQLALCDKATIYVVVKAAPTNSADLAITKTGPATVSPGSAINYQLTVTNLGTETATKVQINDFLPAALQNPRYTANGNTVAKDWSGYYELNELKINETFSLEISGMVSASAPDTLKNVATVFSLQWDPNLDNNISVVKSIVSRGAQARILGAPYLTVGSCNTQGRVLDASSSKGDGLSFSWTPTIYLDNATSSKPIFSPGKTTRYKLTVTDSKGEQDTTSVLVVVAPAPLAVTEKSVFVETPNETIMLSGSKSTGAGLSYLWLSKEGIILNGETTPTAQVSGLGMYYLQVTDSLGCSSKDSVNVGLYIQAVNDTAETKVNESVVINVLKNDQPANSINPSSISIVTPPLHGIATVDADSLILYLPEESYIGQDEFVYQVCDYFKRCDQAKVLVLINDVPFFIPDAFSPNGDGKNDKFEIKGLHKYQTVGIEIINRWGNTVYQSKNYGEGANKDGFWDGTASSGLRIGSGPVPTGTYYFILKLNGKENINGSIYLDR